MRASVQMRKNQKRKKLQQVGRHFVFSFSSFSDQSNRSSKRLLFTPKFQEQLLKIYILQKQVYRMKRKRGSEREFRHCLDARKKEPRKWIESKRELFYVVEICNKRSVYTQTLFFWSLYRGECDITSLLHFWCPHVSRSVVRLEINLSYNGWKYFKFTYTPWSWLRFKVQMTVTRNLCTEILSQQ